MLQAIDSAFGKGYGETKKRTDEKRLAVLKWLYQFNVSTQRLLATMLGVDERGQYQFFSRLRSSGLVETFQHEALGRELLYRLSGEGMAVAAMHHGYALIKPQKVSHQVLMHDLTVQAAVVRRLTLIDGGAGGESPLIDFVSERQNGAPINGKKPDTLLTYAAHKLALELELSHKNSARVYYNYLSHLKNIRDKHYGAVAYVFTSERLRNLYEAKFSEPTWPIYAIGKNNRLVLTPTPFELKPESRRFFSFTVEHGYFV